MQEYILSTGEKTIKKDGLYYLKGGEVTLTPEEMHAYLQSQSSKLHEPKDMPESIREKAEYDWKHSY